MATLTLAQLLTVQDAQTIYQTLLGVYASFGFPVTSWQDGETEKTRLLAVATALADISGNYNPQVAAGGFIDFSTGQWLRLKAQEDYNIPYNAATVTVGQITITQTSAIASSQTITPGKMTAVFISGNRYFLTGFIVGGSFTVTPQTLAFGSPLVGVFAASSPGAAFNDPSNSTISSSTPLPGVVLTNPSTNFSAVGHTGSGTGSVTPSGTPVGSHSVIVIIGATSAGNPATVSYELDGGAAVSLGAVSSVSNLAGTGINFTFVPGGSGTSWVNNDTYSFSTPASWITSQGSDDEKDPVLAQRCRDRWASLANIPTGGLYQLLAQSTPGIGSQVTQCLPVVDAVINNKINIVVAGPGGVLPPPTIAIIQAYIAPWARGTDNPVVQSPTTTPITIAATITGSARQLAAIQAGSAAAINNYIASLSINPTIKLSVIDSSIVPNPVTGVGGIPGVTDISGVTINGVAENLVLGGPGVFVLPAYPPTLNLSYVTT